MKPYADNGLDPKHEAGMRDAAIAQARGRAERDQMPMSVYRKINAPEPSTWYVRSDAEGAPEGAVLWVWVRPEDSRLRYLYDSAGILTDIATGRTVYFQPGEERSAFEAEWAALKQVCAKRAAEGKEDVARKLPFSVLGEYFAAGLLALLLSASSLLAVPPSNGPKPRPRPALSIAIKVYPEKFQAGTPLVGKRLHLSTVGKTTCTAWIAEDASPLWQAGLDACRAALQVNKP